MAGLKKRSYDSVKNDLLLTAEIPHRKISNSPHFQAKDDWN